jgi:hypothetical protein
MYDGFSKLPVFRAIKQGGLYVGIEDPYFGVLQTFRDTKSVHFYLMYLNP